MTEAVKIDIYEKQDEIEASLKTVIKIIEDAEIEDPEFYAELEGIFTHTPT